VTTVSVIIPVFNRAHLVASAVGSVLAQKCENCDVRVVVVDDGSSDDLAEALRPYGARVSCIRHDKNAGAAAARNTGVGAVTGEYVAFLDSDDEWLPSKLARQIELMRQHRWVASCTAYYLSRPGTPEIISPRIETGQISLADLVWGCFVSPGSTLMFERSIFADVGPLDATLGRLEDWDWLLRYARTRSLGFIAEPLARIHVSPQSNAAPVLAAIDALRSKHSASLGARDRRHFEAALDLEMAAAFYRTGRPGRAVPAFLRSLARAPFAHPALAAVLHNRSARN
jgi:glycosyltransferase involved in cell wall biosynthesis